MKATLMVSRLCIWVVDHENWVDFVFFWDDLWVILVVFGMISACGHDSGG